jgi:hypothetical protein
MKVALESGSLAVLDDVLAERDFVAVNRIVGDSEYRSVHSRGWDRAWRLWDGNPLRGSAVYYDPPGARGWEGASYPTSTAFDHAIEAVRQAVAERPLLVGVEGTDWTALFMAPWLYPVGSALSLHLDGGAFSGAFTYFAHSRWSLQWGGELLVLPPRMRPRAGQPIDLRYSQWISESDDLEAELGPGTATCVFPRPNRLVLVGPDRPHMIRRVDANAGAHIRASLAGFFLRP